MPDTLNNDEIVAEIAELRSKKREAEQQAQVKREAAELLKTQIKASGLNPITGTSSEDKDAFRQIDEAYKESDGLFQLAAEFDHRIRRLVEHASGDALVDADGDPDSPAFNRAVALRTGRATIARRAGDRLLASAQYQALAASKNLLMKGARVNMDPVTVLTREELLASPIFRAATVVGDPLTPTDERLFPPVEFPVRPLRVRDLVFVSETDTDLVEYVEETTRTDPAAETPYGTAAPEATYVYTLRSAPVKRIPQSVPATKGNLADRAQLRGLLENRLIYGVGKRADTQMISGDGTGDNLTGVLNTAGIGSQAQGTDSKSDAFHKAMTVVRIAFEDEPDAFLLHPTPYQAWALEKGSDGHYVNHQGPQTATSRTIWGKPVVVNTVVGAATGIVGAWMQGATLWVREGVDVAASDSHSDFFTKGLVMLLAELRAAFAVVQPKAFCQITGL